VHRFFENCFHLVPDIHAHVKAGERAMVRLPGGLADTLSAIEMVPLKLRIRGTAGCGKSIVAGRYVDAAVASAKRPLLVCFNRSLAERLKMTVSQGTTVDTFYGLMDRFLGARGHSLDYSQMSSPGFWQKVQEQVICESIDDDWKFDALVVDEGQDFEPQWVDLLRLFIREDADLLWLEDPDQAIRIFSEKQSSPEPAYLGLGSGLIGYRARANYRSPETIASYIKRVLPFDFIPANPLPGLGVGVTTYKEPDDQSRRVAAIVTELLRLGFSHGEIVILSMRGLARASLTQEKRVGSFTLSRPTGGYDLLGNQLFEKGQLRFDTVYRFKGQQAPAIILTDIDPGEDRFDHTQRLLFSAMTRATVRLELLVREQNQLAKLLLNG
jgi:superfamily I DNA and RNA helicase